MHPAAQPADSISLISKVSCRICQSELLPILDFGKMPLANAFLDQKDFEQEYFFNLATGFCSRCFMFQLLEQPAPEKMFHQAYPFYTRSSQRMVEHFKQLAETLKKFLYPGAFLVEMGSNDGTLLENFQGTGIECMGIEPSANVAAEALKRGIPTQIDFFGPQVAAQLAKQSDGADVLVAANCLCHIPDLASVFSGLGLLLKKTGVAVFEDPYLGEVLAKTAYDQIYDEHVFLFSVTSMSEMLSSYGFEIFDLEPQWTHGGSMRYFICRKGQREPSASVAAWLAKESEAGFKTLKPYEEFRKRVEISKVQLLECLENFKRQAVPVAGYAATSKSTTVLNYCGIGPELISFISDTTPDKQGKLTPGSHIPVVPPEIFHQANPKAAVLFAWNHAAEILRKEENFKASGGKWIHFVPKVQID